MTKNSLAGSLLSSSGTAPEKALSAVDGKIRRPQEVWISGNPRDTVDPEGVWKRQIDEKLEASDSNLGLRLRFVVERLGPDLDLLSYTGAVINTLPDEAEPLFLHSELMIGPEEGLYLAYDNRVPALLTQVWIAKRKSYMEAQPLPVVICPIHFNLALHDAGIGYAEIWNDGTLDYALKCLEELVEDPFTVKDIHQVTVARCDTHDHGISLGLEQVRDEFGAFGGNSAAQPGSRA